jgi:putative ABC transport system ATP-binding protein
MIILDDVYLTLDSSAGPVDILRGVSLDVEAGEAVGVVGPSGSGKSTMLAAIAGLERPTSGTVRINGTDITGMDEDALARFRRDTIGVVFQAFHLIPTMTALENVAVPLELAGRADAFDIAREGMAAVGLADRLSHYPGQLSGGEQQRVALARAVAARPKLILADEPTGNLDQATGHEVIELMFRVQAESGATLVLITHDPELAERCGRRLHIVDGRITASNGDATA